jgi:hypothetical protein
VPLDGGRTPNETKKEKTLTQDGPTAGGPPLHRGCLPNSADLRRTIGGGEEPPPDLKPPRLGKTAAAMPEKDCRCAVKEGGYCTVEEIPFWAGAAAGSGRSEGKWATIVAR